MNIRGCFPLGLTGLISMLYKGPSIIFFSTTIQKHQFFTVQPSLWSNSHIHTCCWVTSVVSDSLRPHGLQHARLPYPWLTPGACSNSCPLSWWCHPTISSFVLPFSSCLQSFPASGSFQMSQFLASGFQSIGVSASASVLSVNIQDWFPLGWTGWISLQSKGLSRVFLFPQLKKLSRRLLGVLKHLIPFSFWRTDFFYFFFLCCCCCLVPKSCLTLWPHGLQHARPPCASPSPRACFSAFSKLSREEMDEVIGI